MTEATTRVIPTVDEVRQQLASLSEKINALTFHHVYIIEDYPIGRRDRGKCELSYQHDRRCGYRTYRRTTNKSGKWCTPKYSTYDETPIIVVTGPSVPREAAWLRFSSSTVYLQEANGDCLVLYRAPHGFRPNREARSYTITMRPIFGLPGAGESTTHTTPADPPELCDAWDEWERWLKENVPAIAKRIHAVAPVMC